MRRRMFMTEKNIEKLEYIQSAGTQYIDTEYIPKVNTVLEMDIQFVENEYKTNPQLFKTGMTNTFFGAIDSGAQMFSANFGGGTAQWGMYSCGITKETPTVVRLKLCTVEICYLNEKFFA